MMKLDVSNSKSLLPLPVKELLAMIFDMNAMNKALLEMEVELFFSNLIFNLD